MVLEMKLEKCTKFAMVCNCLQRSWVWLVAELKTDLNK